MEALEFMNEFARMCAAYRKCQECLLNTIGCYVAEELKKETIPKIVGEVEEWSKAHPKKTRQSEFLKMFPNAKMLPTGVLVCRPCEVDSGFKADVNCSFGCNECRKRYWTEMIEDEISC